MVVYKNDKKIKQAESKLSCRSRIYIIKNKNNNVHRIFLQSDWQKNDKSLIVKAVEKQMFSDIIGGIKW